MTPPAEVVVAIRRPLGSTARMVPAGVPSDVNHTEEVAVNWEVEATVRFWRPVHQLA